MTAREEWRHLPRGRRADAGQVRLTERDARVLTFLGDQFGAPLGVVAELYDGAGERVTRRHAARLERAGMVARSTVAGAQWLVPTRAGLRFAGLEFEAWAPRAWKLEHVEGVARLRLALAALDALGAIHPAATWTSERAIRARWAGKGARVRYADGQLDLADGRVVGVELELHRKPARLYAGIGRDVDPAFDEVWWFCPGGDVAWLTSTLTGVTRQDRPVHLVAKVPGSGS